MDRWFYISVDYATFGICSKNGIITHAAPIVKWMIGKTLLQIKPWLLNKKAKVIEI